jgi:hypothetical protein
VHPDGPEDRCSWLSFLSSCSRIALWNPPPSSSLAEEERLRSLLLRSAARDFRRLQL